jgi:serine/threonine protein kinase
MSNKLLATKEERMMRALPGAQEDAVSAASFLETVQTYSERYAPQVAPLRHIRPPSGPDARWIQVSYEDGALRDQGWKLHLSASLASAEQVLQRALPVLLSEAVSFKVLASLQELAKFNDGRAGLSQIGKFLTIYPGTDDEAVHLAVTLDAITHGLSAPAIPSDRPLRPGSIVFYRYGGFQARPLQNSWGLVQLMLETPDQQLVPDVRASSYTPPDWVSDPFLLAGVAEALPEPGVFLAGRFLLLATLYQSAQSKIQFAVDLETAQSCMIKRPGLGASSGEESLSQRLQHEAQVLALLASYPGFPQCSGVYEEQGEPFLVLEDLAGETLATSLLSVHAQSQRLPRARLLSWGKELAMLLHVLHTLEFVYSDVKSTNVIVMPDDHLRLIDFGLVQLLGSERPGAAGTAGYMSPQQENGEPVAVSDDMYGLGALLYHMASGAEPSSAPRLAALTTRPLLLLNPDLDAPLVEVIERCLAPMPGDRFASMSELISALTTLQDYSPGSASLPGSRREEPLPIKHTPENYRQFAHRLSDTLSKQAQPDPQGQGLRWRSTHPQAQSMQRLDLNIGQSGTLLAFSELVSEFQESQQHSQLAEAAHWLVTAPRLPGASLPGLYVGEAGIGTALLRASQVLDDSELLDIAVRRSLWVAAQPFASPDLFNGTAGRIRFHLWLWDATGDALQLQRALEGGGALLSSAEEVRTGEVCWTIPPGYEGMSGSVYLGFAHGAAGIADVLLDLYEASGQERFLSMAQAAGNWLTQQAISVLVDGSGLDWPDTQGEQPRGSYWCHGATGIGSFFLHAAQLQVLPSAAEIAERAARTVAHGNRACSPVQCHGLAGNIEFLLDMAQATGQQHYRTEAYELAELLTAFAVEKDGMLTWSSESPLTVTPDYMVGYAGIAMTLLRLGDPQRPRQLSRHGLNGNLVARGNLLH